MCGFLVNSSDLHIDPSQSLLARGPDEQGSIIVDQLLLRNFRLSIVGLDAGIQPCQSDKSIFLFNGEIYNFKKVADKFKLSSKAALSDTVCVHELIDLIGLSKTIPELVGHYAFFYHDNAKSKGYFSRDVMGVKPLFYYLKDEKLIVSSDIHTIVSCTSQQIIPERAMEAIMFGGHTGETTLYSDIKATVPGRIYCFDTTQQSLTSESIFEPDYKEKLHYDLFELIKASIDEQSDIDVPGVCLVSSGIDSRIVKKVALPKNNLIAVTAASPDLDLLQEDINTDSDTIKVNVSAEYSELSFEYMLQAYGTIPAHNNFFALCMMYHEIAKSKLHNSPLPIKVAITGEGADEYFGGYGRYKELKTYLNGHKSAWINELQEISNFWLYLMNTRINHRSIAWLKEKGVNIDEITRQHINAIPDFETTAEPSIEQLSSYDVQTNLMYGLHKQDLAGMLSSIEVRVPFLNQHLHFWGRNGKLADSSEKVSKLKLRDIAEKIGIDQKVKIGFPVSLKKFIPEDYIPSQKLINVLPFIKESILNMPEDIFQGIYMLDLLLRTQK
jgi:asparagine synthase (glutamine-hydrolysing)